jgi:hypothetical protein
MYAIAEDLEQAIKSIDLDRLVVVEEAVEYPGELVFQLVRGEQVFYSRYRDWVSVFCVLNELYNLPAFIDQLRADGYEPVFRPSTEPILANLARWNEPLKIEGYAGAGQ